METKGPWPLKKMEATNGKLSHPPHQTRGTEKGEGGMGARDLETTLSGEDLPVMTTWILRRKGWDEQWHSVAGWVDKTGKSNAEGRPGVRSAGQIRKALGLSLGLRVLGPIRGRGQSMAASAVAEVRGGNVGGLDEVVEARGGLEKEVKMCFLGWAHPCAWRHEQERLSELVPTCAHGTSGERQDGLGKVGEVEVEVTRTC